MQVVISSADIEQERAPLGSYDWPGRTVTFVRGFAGLAVFFGFIGSGTATRSIDTSRPELKR